MSERLFAVALEQLSVMVARGGSETKEVLGGLEQQIAELQDSSRDHSDALNQALGKIAAAIEQQALDRAGTQAFSAQIEHRLGGLDDSLKTLEMRLTDAKLEIRLSAIEQAVGSWGVTGGATGAAAGAAAGKPDEPSLRPRILPRALAERLDTLEWPRTEQWAHLRPQAPDAAMAPSRVPDGGEPPAFALEPAGDTHEEPRWVGAAFDEEFDAAGEETAHARAHTAEAAQSSPRYFVPALIAVVAIVALATGLTVTERGRAVSGAPPAPATEMRTLSLPELPDTMPRPPGAQTTPRLATMPAAFANAPVSPAATSLSPPARANDLDDTLFVVAPQDYGRPHSDGKFLAPATQASKEISSEQLAQMANAGNAAALTILGLRALDDRGAAPVNLAEAVRDLTRAAEKGQAVAQFRLGSLYEHGDGVAADPAKAAHWYELAAQQGNRKAMHNLAVFYAVGALGQKNLPEASRWFAKAAALGLTDSQFNLAYLYERGDGVPKSPPDAYKWYAIAAAAGDKESKTRLGLLQSSLSPADRTNASRLATNFHPLPLNLAANVPPTERDF